MADKAGPAPVDQELIVQMERALMSPGYTLLNPKQRAAVAIRALRLLDRDRGMVLVPREPTDAMREAIIHAKLGDDCLGWWRAGIAAAPEP